MRPQNCRSQALAQCRRDEAVPPEQPRALIAPPLADRLQGEAGAFLLPPVDRFGDLMLAKLDPFLHGPVILGAGTAPARDGLAPRPTRLPAACPRDIRRRQSVSVTPSAHLFCSVTEQSRSGPLPRRRHRHPHSSSTQWACDRLPRRHRRPRGVDKNEEPDLGSAQTRPSLRRWRPTISAPVPGWRGWDPPSIGRLNGCHTTGRAASKVRACAPTAGAALLRTPDRRRIQRATRAVAP